MFSPKTIVANGDWLCSHREKPQTFNIYNRPGVRNEVTSEREKIYFLITDEKINEGFVQKLKKYTEAFYTGLKVEIMYPKTTKTAK